MAIWSWSGRPACFSPPASVYPACTDPGVPESCTGPSLGTVASWVTLVGTGTPGRGPGLARLCLRLPGPGGAVGCGVGGVTPTRRIKASLKDSWGPAWSLGEGYQAGLPPQAPAPCLPGSCVWGDFTPLWAQLGSPQPLALPDQPWRAVPGEALRSPQKGPGQPWCHPHSGLCPPRAPAHWGPCWPSRAGEATEAAGSTWLAVWAT